MLPPRNVLGGDSEAGVAGADTAGWHPSDGSSVQVSPANCTVGTHVAYLLRHPGRWACTRMSGAWSL